MKVTESRLVEQPDHVGRVLGWLAVAAVALHPTQASFDVLRGVGGARLNLCAVDLVIGAAFALWAVRRWRRRDLLWPPVSRAAVLGVIWLLLSLIPALKGGDARDISVSWKQGVVKVLQFFEYFIAAYILFAEVFREEAWRRRALGVLSLVTVLAVVCAWVQYFRKDVPVTGVRGTWFENRNTFGAFLALVLPLLFGVSVLGKSWLRRFGLTILTLAALLVCLSGGAFLALCLGLLVVGALKRGTKFFVAATALALVAVLVLPHLPRRNSAVLLDSVALYKDSDPHDLFGGDVIRLKERLEEKQAGLAKKIRAGEPVSWEDVPREGDFSWKWQQRYKEWQAALNMTVRSPLFGVGVGSYQANVNAFYGGIPKPPVNLMEPDALSGYLVWGASAGLPFLLMMLGMVLRPAIRAGRAFCAKRNRGLAAGVLGSLAALAVLGVFTNPLVRGVGVTLALVLALGETLSEPRPEDTEGGSPKA